MCGVVGYVGPRKAPPILIKGLESLEYRGYDSAGVALIGGDGICVVKRKGRVAELKTALGDICSDAHIGIAHTRWATHGSPSDINSHPQTDTTGKFAIVHNGIIENYLMLKEALEGEGVVFRSQTDTEVAAHLVAKFYRGDLAAAVRETVSRLRGSFSLLILHADEPDKIICAAKDSPLIVGEGDGENFIASDIPALLDYTKKFYRLSDGEIAVVTDGGAEFFAAGGEKIDKSALTADWDAAAARLNGFESFMLKEIHEIPAAVADTLAAYTGPGGPLSAIPDEFFRDADRVIIIGCGTAYHAGLAGKYAIERLARLPVSAEIASEFRYGSPVADERTLCVAVSQSGETADTIAALKEAKSLGCKTLALSNVAGSRITCVADYTLPTFAGPEIAVASTKAYNSQLIVMYALCAHICRARKTMTAASLKRYFADMKKLPALASRSLDVCGAAIRKLALECKDENGIFFIGRGLDYYTAMESGLKLKEISYIRCEAYAAGELKHGTLALIENGATVIALITEKTLADKTLSNISEVKARGARVIAIVSEDIELPASAADSFVRIPAVPALFAPVLAVIPCQMLAYYTARARGCDADKPRNLAKSVTVE